MLKINDYPDGFVRGFIAEGDYQSIVKLAEDKGVYITVPLKGDKPFEQLELRLSEAFGKSSPSTHVRVISTTTPTIVQRVHLVLTCVCEIRYKPSRKFQPQVSPLYGKNQVV